MKTEVKFFDTVNRDKDGNSVELSDFNLTDIQFLPRIGENVFFNGSISHYLVKEIQHVFKKESEYETEHIINIHLTTT
jgi:hypothetical protein